MQSSQSTLSVAPRCNRSGLYTKGKQVRFVGKVLTVNGNTLVMEATDRQRVTVHKTSFDLQDENLEGRTIEVIGTVSGQYEISESRTFLWKEISMFFFLENYFITYLTLY